MNWSDFLDQNVNMKLLLLVSNPTQNLEKNNKILNFYISLLFY